MCSNFLRLTTDDYPRQGSRELTAVHGTTTCSLLTSYNLISYELWGDQILAVLSLACDIIQGATVAFVNQHPSADSELARYHRFCRTQLSPTSARDSRNPLLV